MQIQKIARAPGGVKAMRQLSWGMDDQNSEKIER